MTWLSDAKYYASVVRPVDACGAICEYNGGMLEPGENEELLLLFLLTLEMFGMHTPTHPPLHSVFL